MIIRFFFLKTVIAIITSFSPHPCPKPLLVIGSNLIELGIFQKMLSDHRAIQFTEVVFFFSLSPLLAAYAKSEGGPRVINTNGLVGTENQKVCNDSVCPLHVVDD